MARRRKRKHACRFGVNKRTGACLKSKRSRPSSRSRRKGYRKSRHRKPAGMARRGSKCTSFKRVRVRGGGMQKRCRKYRR